MRKMNGIYATRTHHIIANRKRKNLLVQFTVKHSSDGIPEESFCEVGTRIDAATR